MDTVNINTDNQNVDYTRLIAAQNESQRRLKILDINNRLTEENKKRNQMAVISGACLVAVVASVMYSGLDTKQALETEIKAINSISSLKDYLAMISPGVYASILAAASSITSYIKHDKKYKEANREFYDMMDNRPEDYMQIVEGQAHIK